MGLPRVYYVAAPLLIVSATYLLWSSSPPQDTPTIDGRDTATSSREVAAHYWKETLSQESMPTMIRDMVSPLSPLEAARIAGLIEHQGALTLETAVAICTAAGHSCPAGAAQGDAEEKPKAAAEEESWYQSMSEMYFTEHTLLTDPDLTAPNWVVTVGGARLKRPLLPRAIAHALKLRPVVQNGTSPDSNADEVVVGYSVEAAMRQLYIDHTSHMGKGMESTRGECAHMYAVAKRQTACVFSTQDLADVLATLLRPKEQGLRLEALASSSSHQGGTTTTNGFRLIHSELKVGENGHLVTCHALPFPSQALMCHTAGNTEVYETTLQSTNAASHATDVQVVKQVVIFHTDTRTWTPQHPILQALRLKPGQSVVSQRLARNIRCRYRLPLSLINLLALFLQLLSVSAFRLQMMFNL